MSNRIPPLLSVVESDLPVPLVGGGEVQYAHLDYAASAPARVEVAAGVAEALPYYASVHRRAGQLTTAIGQISTRVEEQMRPFSRQLDQLATIPGVGRPTAEVIIAETGADMTRFATAGHLASWAGLCPGHHESAGKSKSGRTRHGNRWLTAALGTAAMAAARTKNKTYLGARYRRLTPRSGKQKALVAIEHSILTAAWHMLTNDLDHHDLGGDYYTRRDPERATRHAIAQLNTLGYTVTLNPINTA